MPEHIGLLIKQLREERKLSKARLAREAGFSDAYLVQIEKGDRTPSADVLRSLANALRVPPHRLLIPAGVYSDERLADVRERVNSSVGRIEAERGTALTEEERDRLTARALEHTDHLAAQDEYLSDPANQEAEFVDYLRDEDPLSLTPEQFWQWDVKDSWAPEHWGSLSDRDRRLVQQLINRLVELAD